MTSDERTRAELERLRKRERELSALMASLRELVEVRDVQRLLQKLVDRAHELTGTDLTYLSEYDAATDELFVRANRGAISPNMRSLRVPAGVGLASKVVQTRTAQWTAAYDVAAFPHESEVSAAVEAERMESILGVPLISSGRVLGVLFAADRSTHNFNAEQIALLTAFADQAAVILQSARLLAAEREAAASAATASAEAQRRAAAMEASASLHEQLTRLVLEGEGSGAIAATLAGSLRRPVAIADRHLAPLATSDERAAAWWTEGQLTTSVLAAIEESRSTARWVDVGDEAPDVLGVVAAMAGRTLLGVILVGGDELDEVQRRTIERGAQSHALVTVQRDAVADAEERVRGELVGDLVSGRGDWATLRHRASQRGVDLAGSWTPVAAVGWGQQRWSLVRSLSALDGRWLVAEHDAGVVALAPGANGPELAERVHTRLSRVPSARTGPGTGLVLVGREVPVEAIPAELTALSRMLPGVGVVDGAVMAADYAPYLALFGPDGERALAFAHGLLAPVLEWDASHRSDLVGPGADQSAPSGNNPEIVGQRRFQRDLPRRSRFPAVEHPPALSTCSDEATRPTAEPGLVDDGPDNARCALEVRQLTDLHRRGTRALRATMLPNPRIVSPTNYAHAPSRAARPHPQTLASDPIQVGPWDSLCCNDPRTTHDRQRRSGSARSQLMSGRPSVGAFLREYQSRMQFNASFSVITTNSAELNHLADFLATQGRLASFGHAFIAPQRLVSTDFPVPPRARGLIARRQPPRHIPRELCHSLTPFLEVGQVLLAGRAPALQKKLLYLRAERMSKKSRRLPGDILIASHAAAAESFQDHDRTLRVLNMPSIHPRMRNQILVSEMGRNPVYATSLSDHLVPLELIARAEYEFSLADLILVPSSFAADSLANFGVEPSKLLISPYGVEPRPQVVRKHDGPLRVLYAGRLTQAKGLSYLLDAIQSMPPQSVSFRAIGTPQDDLSHYPGFNDWWTAEGPMPRTELLDEFHRADVLVLPSLFEGMPLVVLEALSTGLPVIATDTGAGAVLRDAQEGFLVPSRDSGAIAERLQQLATSIDLRTQMSHRAYARSLEFSWQHYGNRTMELIDARNNSA